MAALLSNWENVEAAVKSASEAEGSAARENAKYIDSIQGRLDKLTTAWQSFANTFMSSDFLKGAVSGLTKFVETIEELVDILGTVGTIGLGAGIWATISQVLSTSKAVGGLKSFADVLPMLSLAFPNAAKGIGIFKDALSSGTGIIGVFKAALKGLWTVIAAHPIIAVVAAVGAGIAIFNHFYESADELAERISDLTSKYKEQSESLQKLKGDYDTTNESSMVSKYAKLSKGVDNLGRNVSLTSEEYAEYQSIVGKIADQFPSLVSGYDSQGNALLSCKGNVEELTEAYEKLIHTQNQEILTNTQDIEKNFKNASKDAGDISFWEKLGHSTPIVKWFMEDELTTDVVERLEKSLGNPDALDGYWDGWDSDAIRKALTDAKVDVKWYQDPIKVLKETLKSDPAKIKGMIDNHYAQFAEIVEQQKTIATAKLSEAFDVSSVISGLDYGNISEDLQAVAYQVVNSLDKDFFDTLQEKGKSVEQWTTEMLNQLNSISPENNAEIEAAFDLQTQFNGGEISYGEYVKGLEDTGKLIDGLNLKPELETQLKLSIGLDEKGFVAGYKKLANRLADSDYFNIGYTQYHDFIDSLSAEEVSVLWKVIPELEETDYKETIADIKAALEKQMMLDGLTFDLNLEVEAAGIEALNTALAESVSGSGLSSDSINALKSRYAELENQGWDLSTMFEETSHGIHLNRQELNKFEKAYASQKLEEVNGDLSEMKATYDELGEQLKTCSDEAKAGIYSERFTLAQKISEAATMAAQLEGLTSAYNDWLAAEEAGQERDMYENIISGFETIDDEVSRGWYDDSTREFIEMLTGKDMGTASIDELKKAYKDLDKEIKNTGYSIRDFFTVDDEGNSTADGVYRFLKAVETLESDAAFKEVEGIKNLIQRDENGKVISFDFGIVGGDEAIAEALGISEELVQIMKRAASDAGFVVTLDGSYQQLADLEKAANEAANTLKSLGKTDFDFNLNTTNVKDLTTQLTEAHKILKDKSFWNADGTFNFNADGAKEAMQLVSTLQAKLDYLTQEQYGIGLTVEDEEFEEPLENLQKYGNTIATLNQLRLNPQVNAEKITELEGDLQEIAQEFNELPDEKKIELGLVDDKGKPLNNTDDIQKKIESGEVKIPTVLDIQTNMDKNLETLADLALLDSGLLSDSQEQTIRGKYNVEVEGDVDTSGLENEVENAVDDAVNGKGGSTTREANIQIIANVFGIEDVNDLTSKLKGLDDKTIQAIAEVLGRADVEKLQQTMALIEPKTVEAIAKAIGQGDVEGLKEAIINIPNKKHAQAIAEALGYEDVNALANAVGDLSPKTVQAIAQALGISDVNTLQVTINNMHGNTVDAKVDTSGQAGKVNTLQITIDGMQGNTVKAGVDTDGQAGKVDTLQAKINSLKGKIVNVGVQLAAGGKKKAAQRTGADPDGKGTVNGTANVNGTTGRAFTRGDWRTKKTETALVGELGREIIVTPENRWYTVGDNGAEFTRIPKNSIVFNHLQTEELLRKGKVTSGGGRAKALVNGTAYLGGTAYANSVGRTETFDWLEILLTRLEKAVDDLVDSTDNIYSSWTDREKALYNKDENGNESGAIVENRNLIATLKKAVSQDKNSSESYWAAAENYDLDDSLKEKIRNGALTPESKGLSEQDAKKIQEYQELWDKYLKAEDDLAKALITEAELWAQRFDNVISEYDGILQGFEHTESMLNEYINQAEAKGHVVSKNYYQALIDNNEKNVIPTLKNQQSEMLAARQDYVDAMQAQGMSLEDIYDSEQYRNMSADIDGVTQDIEAANTATIEWNNAMRDIDWQVFDLMQERISDITAEADFLIDLMSNKDLFDDNGNFTEQGVATMGLHGQNYNTYMYAADEYGKEIAKLDSQIASDPYDQELINRRRELIELQREAILNAEDEKNAIKDMVEEGINLELDALQERIDLHNEELDSMKDLYDYQKNVQKQSEEIAALEKQRAAYLNDNSAESQAKLQEITVSLKEAKENLQETEYNKYISDQQALLDNLYNEYELTLNSRLDNIDFLLDQVIAGINAAAGVEGTITSALGSEGAIAVALGNNATTIKTTLETETNKVGITLSDAMNKIWSTGDGNAKSVLTTYGTGFQNKQTTTNAVLNDIKAYISRMVDDVDKDAQVKVNSNPTKPSSVANPTGGSSGGSGSGSGSGGNKSTGDGKPKIGDKVKFLSGKYYYDSQGVTPAGSKNHGKEVYITNVNTRSWATHPYHISTGKKLGSGDLGWLKLNQISGYATGKKNFLNNEIAWTQENGREFIVRPSDGAILTPIAKGDSVLDARASGNIWDMANSPAEFIKDNLKLDVANVPNGSSVSNSTVQNFEQIVFSMPNVLNYEQLLSEMQKDKNFERLVLSMSVDRLAGKSSLGKNKSIR